MAETFRVRIYMKIAHADKWIDVSSWVATFLLTPRLIAGATDTSTSDLVIQPGSICVSRQLWKSLIGGTEKRQESLTKLWMKHITNAHCPPVAIPGLGTLVKLNVLASGAYSHEVSTSLASCLVFLRCLQSVPPPGTRDQQSSSMP